MARADEGDNSGGGKLGPISMHGSDNLMQRRISSSASWGAGCQRDIRRGVGAGPRWQEDNWNFSQGSHWSSYINYG
jgi:hypothetical protein